MYMHFLLKSVLAVRLENRLAKNTAIMYSRCKPMVTKRGTRICKRRGNISVFVFNQNIK